jgi:NhaP-type Na+/H+ or K+/H+ antiporter
MLIVGLFAAVLFGYAVVSRSLGTWSVTPQIVSVAAGLLLGLASTEITAGDLASDQVRLVGEIALVLCLFTDASRIDIRSIRGMASLPTRLLLVGLPLTIALGVVFGLVLLPGLGLAGAFLLAVLLAPTDAGLGAAVVNDVRIPVRIRQAINVESGLNDGLVTPLVLFAVAIEETESGGAGTDWVRFAVSEIGIGVVVGIGLGVVGARLVHWARAHDRLSTSFRWAAAPALAILAWAITPMLGGNAFIAAFVAGMSATAAGGRLPDAFTEFGETAGELAGLAVFFLFGALVTLIDGYSIPVVAYAVLSLTVIRMLPVAVALIRTRLSLPTVAFIGWFGPRGLASIVLTLLALGDGGSPHLAPGVTAAVTVTVLLSVVLHGLSAGPLVERYARFTTGLPTSAPELGDTPELATRRASGHASSTPSTS